MSCLHFAVGSLFAFSYYYPPQHIPLLLVAVVVECPPKHMYVCVYKKHLIMYLLHMCVRTYNMYKLLLRIRIS